MVNLINNHAIVWSALPPRPCAYPAPSSGTSESMKTFKIFVFFNLSVSAAEAAVGLAIIVIFFRKKDSIHIDDIDTLKG